MLICMAVYVSQFSLQSVFSTNIYIFAQRYEINYQSVHFIFIRLEVNLKAMAFNSESYILFNVSGLLKV